MKLSSTAAPTVLLVGFLGSGKTSFLRTLLPLLEAKGLEPFVIINDYQNAKIDASSLKASVKEVAPINGNYVCCDSIHELINTLLAVPPKPNRAADHVSAAHAPSHASLRGSHWCPFGRGRAPGTDERNAWCQ